MFKQMMIDKKKKLYRDRQQQDNGNQRIDSANPNVKSLKIDKLPQIYKPITKAVVSDEVLAINLEQ